MNFLKAALASMALVVFTSMALADVYPSRPVRIFLPYGPGDVSDIATRIIADKLGEKLGQRFVIENRPGAGGIAAAQSALSAMPDGYTLIVFTNGVAISVSLLKSLPFDPGTDFIPVSTFGYFGFTLVTNASSQYQTLGDVLKAAREAPGKLNIGTLRAGSTVNLVAELLKSTAKVNLAVIPYRTTSEALIALLRNDVEVAVGSYAALRSGIDDKKLRVVATTGPTRSQVLPSVPTVQEAGGGEFDALSWAGLFAPKGTPAEAIAILQHSLIEVLAMPDVKQRLLKLGIEAKASNSDELGARQAADTKKWGEVIERTGIPKQ
jgi:tripartite-type tricarboxylate transporter receptor subunit TctC